MGKRRHHHRHNRNRNRSFKKNIFNKSASIVKSTSSKYMPKVKSGLEGVGSNVIKTSKNSVPFLQNLTRKLFGVFSQTKKRH